MKIAIVLHICGLHIFCCMLLYDLATISATKRITLTYLLACSANQQVEKISRAQTPLKSNLTRTQYSKKHLRRGQQIIRDDAASKPAVQLADDTRSKAAASEWISSTDAAAVRPTSDTVRSSARSTEDGNVDSEPSATLTATTTSSQPLHIRV